MRGFTTLGANVRVTIINCRP